LLLSLMATAATLPFFLFILPAGALADDRSQEDAVRGGTFGWPCLLANLRSCAG